MWTKPLPQARLDRRLPDIAPDGEVHVEPVAGRVPLWNPQVWKGFAHLLPDHSEEVANICSQLSLVIATGGVRERAQAIQPVGSGVSTDRGPGSSSSLFARSVRIRCREPNLAGFQ
jgi:hypothetical protein